MGVKTLLTKAGGLAEAQVASMLQKPYGAAAGVEQVNQLGRPDQMLFMGVPEVVGKASLGVRALLEVMEARLV